jgi:DDE superfamily endonuclease
MGRDGTTAQNGYSAASYLDVLNQQMEHCFIPGRIFMQDNAPIHTANVVRAWFAELEIPTLEWPPYSPDMNPIEHLWARLKATLIQAHPELLTAGSSQSDKQRLCCAIVEAWKAIPQSYIDLMVEGMPRRISALADAKGWYTKY